MPICNGFHKFIIYFCETKTKGIKKTLKISFNIVAAIILIFATLPILLHFSRVQNFLAQSIVNELSAKLHTKVTVGKIDYKIFNTVSIENLYVEDLQHDTLVYTKKIHANFSFWKFFQGKVKFTAIEIDQLHGNLILDTLGHTNLDFIIKAFEKPKSKDSSNVEYQINHFVLKNSSFNFTDLKQNKTVPIGVFNAGKMKFNKLNADISLDILNKDTLSAEIKSLNAVEHSGLILTDLNTSITASKKGAYLPEFNLKLPNSLLQLEDISVKFDSLADLKKLIDKVRLNAPINSSHVMLSDLRAFVPEFKNMHDIATIKGLISGRISSLRFQKMEIRYGKTFLLNADLDINGLPSIDEAFIYAKINELHVEKNDLQDFISDLTNKPFLLPKELNKLGLVKYKGNISGFLSNLVAYGNLSTNLGSVSTDILIQLENHLKDLKYNGTIKSSNFQLGNLLNSKQLGNISFNFNTKGTKIFNKALKGTIKAKVPELQFNRYSYHDINFTGKYDGTGFDGKVDVKDDNINAQFNGVIDLTKKLPVFDFDLKVLNTNLNALHLIEKYPGATLSFNGKTNMVGNSLDNINGFLNFDSIRFTNQNKTLNVDRIQFVSRIENDATHFIIASDFVNGSLDGDFKYSSIGQTVNQIIQNYLPSFAIKTNEKVKKYPNYIAVDLKVENLKEIADVLQLPYEIEGTSTLKGYIDDKSNRVDLQLNVPVVKSNRLYFENLTFHFENPNNQLKVTSHALLREKDEILNFYLLSTASNDSVSTQLGWQNTQKITNAGEIQTVAKFENILGKTAVNLSILPTQVIINDSAWDIHRSSIDFKTDSAIQIHNFRFDNNKQFIHIDGIASKNQKDSIGIDMNELDLSFLFRILKLQGISIGGIATGHATLRNIMSVPEIEASFIVNQVMLNHKLIGNARLFSNWDKVKKNVNAHALFYDDKNDTLATAKGVYVPKNDSLDFVFDSKKLSIEFLDQYFESVVQSVKGDASGKIRMFGPSKTIFFEGDAFITNGQASVKMLKTTYTFNDSVHLTPKTVKFKNITLYDQERNSGIMSGILNHNGVFKDMNFDINMRSKNILALNTHAEDNDYFFGKAYVNGTVRIYGNEKVANIVVNAISQPNTKCFIQMGGASKASDNTFITFVNNKSTIKNEQVVPKLTESTFNVKINLQFEVTPDAEMELIISPKEGDMITGRGEGNLRVSFDTFSDLKLYGTYVINNGYYLFTMQNLFRKEFKIDQGSTISWSGNPYSGQVNLRAIYPLTVSLKDLAASQLNDNMRSNVPVNCVLKLTNDLMKPTIKFDLELPQSDEAVKQLVKNIVNTDEMMNRQILYLLIFNKFYTPDYMRTQTTNSNVLSNEGVSLLASTLSAQVNNMFSQVFNNVSFGVDYQQSNQTNNPGGEWQGQILYQPNNRLIINGNIGYRTDNISIGSSRFVGDVDLEYLLTQSGKFRFKAYNHTVDRYYLGSSKLSEGVGFVYKEDFATVDDLFKYYWQLLSGNKNKTNNETTTEKK